MDKTPLGPSPAQAGATGDSAAAGSGSKDTPADSEGGVPARPMRLTPGSGSYSGLLAYSRPKLSTSDPSARAAHGVPGVATSDPLEITAVGGGGVPADGMGNGADSGRGGIVAEIASERTSAAAVTGRIETAAFDDSQKVTQVGDAMSRPTRKAFIPRPTRQTPGAGDLSALLGPDRDRGRKEPTPSPAVPETAPLTWMAEGEPPPQPVAPLAVAPESVPQEKKSGFATTIVGVPRPELNIPGSTGWVNTPWVRPAVAGGAGWDRGAVSPAPAPAAADDRSDRMGFTPVRVEDGLTEPTAAPVDADSGPVGFSASSSFSDGGAYDGTRTAVEPSRPTAELGVIAPGGAKRKAGIVAIVTGLLVVAVVLLRPHHPGKVTQATAVPRATAVPQAIAVPIEGTVPASASGPPTPAKVAAKTVETTAESPPPVLAAPPVAPPSPLPVPATTAQATVGAGPSPKVIDPPAASAEQPPASAEHGSAIVTAPAGTTGSKAEQRAAARAARAQASLLKREMRSRGKRKKADRPARKETAIAAPPVESHAPAAHAKPGVAEPDPDGTLPLTGR